VVSLSSCSGAKSADKSRTAPNERELYVVYMEQSAGESRSTSIDLDNCDLALERGHDGVAAQSNSARCTGQELFELRNLFTADKLHTYRADAPYPNDGSPAAGGKALSAGPAQSSVPDGSAAPQLPPNSGADYKTLLITYPPGKADPDTGETKVSYYFGASLSEETEAMLSKLRALNEKYSKP
jgi:hypothetical protein